MNLDIASCKSITFEGFEGYTGLGNLKIVTHSQLELAKIKAIPPYVTELELRFEIFRSEGVGFTGGQTQLLLRYLDCLANNKAVRDNLKVLTL